MKNKKDDYGSHLLRVKTGIKNFKSSRYALNQSQSTDGMLVCAFLESISNALTPPKHFRCIFPVP